MKTPKSARNITIAAIKRKTGNPSDFKYTRYYEVETFSDLTNSEFANFTFSDTELPIFSIFYDSTAWWLFTTSKVVGVFNNESLYIPLEDINEVEWNDWKRSNRIIKLPFNLVLKTAFPKELEVVEIKLYNNEIKKVFVETGQAALVPIYTFKTYHPSLISK